MLDSDTVSYLMMALGKGRDAMEALTISTVSRNLNVSTRMLRYYEQIGLIKSYRMDGYAYRMYDAEAVNRLRQILILRKLRLPLKQIQIILQAPDAVAALEVFRRNIAELNAEMEALSTIRLILEKLVERLNQSADVHVQRLIMQDAELLATIATLSQPATNLKEDNGMEKLEQAESKLHQLKDVRILYLPPATVAAAHFIGDEPEARVGEMIDRFVRENDLLTRKPDMRHYGFNHPNPKDETDYHGYEMWVTIPEDLIVPEPLQKKHFPGGLYAAHMIAMGNFHEWEWLVEWVNAQEDYAFAGDFADQEHMCGLLEEHLNYITHLSCGNTEPEGMQLDLLMPLRAKR